MSDQEPTPLSLLEQFFSKLRKVFPPSDPNITPEEKWKQNFIVAGAVFLVLAALISGRVTEENVTLLERVFASLAVIAGLVTGVVCFFFAFDSDLLARAADRDRQHERDRLDKEQAAELAGLDRQIALLNKQRDLEAAKPPSAARTAELEDLDHQTERLRREREQERINRDIKELKPKAPPVQVNPVERATAQAHAAVIHQQATSAKRRLLEEAMRKGLLAELEAQGFGPAAEEYKRERAGWQRLIQETMET